ncbi:MAG: nucleotidyltransferase domain-containing protein [Candidatus Aenigmarchaeota archaeon]|nr:nucleotidyltransferase domain-containing protein [Candidatus Aenigmarchaeota archaeon]
MGKKEIEVMNQLKKFKHKINKQYHIDKMILFGSLAKGTFHKHSDIDLILVSKKFRNKRILKRSPNLYLEWDLDYPVDFLCYTPEEFEKKKNEISIVREALKNGVEV